MTEKETQTTRALPQSAYQSRGCHRSIDNVNRRVDKSAQVNDRGEKSPLPKSYHIRLKM